LVIIIAAPTPRTSHHQQLLATMRRGLLYGSVVVHDGGNCLCSDTGSGSCRNTALQVVCSLALWWVVAGIGDGSRWAVWGASGGELPIIFDQFSNSFASLALALIAFPDKELCGGPLSDAKSERLERCVG
jgi:hypothetical protein